MPSASTRAVTSAEVPAGNSTTNSIGRFSGKTPCAATASGNASHAAAANHPIIARDPVHMGGLLGVVILTLYLVSAAERVVATHVVAVALRRVAVDERARVKRVGETAYLVLDREERLVALQVDDVLEAVLIIVALLGDQAALEQPPVRAGKIRDVDL